MKDVKGEERERERGGGPQRRAYRAEESGRQWYWVLWLHNGLLEDSQLDFPISR